MSGRAWTDPEVRALSQGWGEVSRRALLKLLPGRTWGAIVQHATTALGLPGGLPQGHVSVSEAARRLGRSNKGVLSLAARHHVQVRRHPCPYTATARAVAWGCIEWDAIRESSERETREMETVGGAAVRRGLNPGWLWFVVRDAGLLPPREEGRQRRPHLYLPTDTIDALIAARTARAA